MDTTHNETRYYLPTLPDGCRRWINIEGWHRVDVPLLKQKGKFSDSYKRVIKRGDHILFEDERDAVMFRLGQNEI